MSIRYDVKIAVLMLVLVSSLTGQDMRRYIGRSLFSDQKAFTRGDAVTILVVETTNASNDAKTT